MSRRRVPSPTPPTICRLQAATELMNLSGESCQDSFTIEWGPRRQPVVFGQVHPRLDPCMQRLTSMKLGDPFGIANNHRATPPPAVAHCRVCHHGGPHPGEFLNPDAPQIESLLFPLALAPSPTALAASGHRNQLVPPPPHAWDPQFRG
jgi:hypothetical protein